MKKIKLSRKAIEEINRKNAAGKKWTQNNDHIIKCYDMYKRRQMTFRQLQDHFPGRTLKAIESKVWKIRGRVEKSYYDNPNQEDLFRKRINE